jgi:hypothetical protein
VEPELVATKANEIYTWDIERHEPLPDREEIERLRPEPVAAGSGS